MTDWNNPLFTDEDTINERAKLMGLKSYDCAIPQTWADEFYDVTGMWPRGIVWSYDDAKNFGRPVAVNELMEKQLALFHVARQLKGSK